MTYQILAWPLPGGGPTDEPITVDELKMRARHDRSDEDPLLPGYIAAARQQVEQDVERALLAQRWRARVVGGSGMAVRLPMPPLQTVESVSTVDASGNVVVLDPADYLVDPLGGRVYLPLDSGDGFVIDYTAGAADVSEVPPLLVQAVAILAVHYLTSARDFVAIGTIVAEMPQSYLDAIQPFKAISLI